MEKLRPSTIAWGTLAAGVVAWDALCPRGETLSEGLDDALETAKGRLFLYTAVGAVAMHLCNLLPDAADPIHQVAKRMRHE